MFFLWFLIWNINFGFNGASFGLPEVDGPNEAKEDCFTGFSQCANSSYCIPETWVCDGGPDCSDGSDEEDCVGKGHEITTTLQPVNEVMINKTNLNPTLNYHLTSQSPPTEISTKKNSLTSAPKETSSEVPPVEETASEVPPVEETASEISKTEEKVSESPLITSTVVQPKLNCSPEYYQCVDRRYCIPKTWVCDGDHDCSDGSDEEDCDNKDNGCLEAGAYNCTLHNSEYFCIPPFWVCDGEDDCSDASDEANCEEKPAPKCPDKFTIFEDFCILLNPFPMRWTRAREFCKDNSARLARFDKSDSLLRKLKVFLQREGLNGLNYWIGKPLGESSSKLPEKEMQIPKWILNGRRTEGKKYPAYINNCYYLDYYDFDYYKSKDCNEYAGVICLNL